MSHCLGRSYPFETFENSVRVMKNFICYIHKIKIFPRLFIYCFNFSSIFFVLYCQWLLFFKILRIAESRNKTTILHWKPVTYVTSWLDRNITGAIWFISPTFADMCCGRINKSIYIPSLRRLMAENTFDVQKFSKGYFHSTTLHRMLYSRTSISIIWIFDFDPNFFLIADFT